MKTEAINKKLVEVSESDLLSLVAKTLKDRVLFPEKVEKAKNYLSKVKKSAI